MVSMDITYKLSIFLIFSNYKINYFPFINNLINSLINNLINSLINNLINSLICLFFLINNSYFYKMFSNILLLSLLAPVVAIIITKLYDKFEKKDYPTKTYIQVGTISYISGVVLLYAKSLICSSGLKCPWNESSSMTNKSPTPSTAPSVPLEKPTSVGLFEKVLKTVSQSGGSSAPNVLTNPTGEIFHTGTPTF
jgi:hypothetical protein